MAERRMFSKSVIVSDLFFNMSVYAQYLYFIFGIYADDDGFVGSPKTIMRQCAIKNSAFEELIQNNYIIPFNSGVIAIKHWKVNNYIQKDRYKTTIYTNELESLEDDKNIYVLTEKGQCIQNVYTLDTQDRLGKDRLGKESLSPLSQNAHTRTHTRDGLGEYENVYLTDSEIEELRKISPMWMDYVFQLSAYMKSTGKTYENHYATLVRWIERDEKQ